MVRAKMRLSAITESKWGPDPSHVTRKLRFDAVYDQKLAEDLSFQKATPNAFAEFTVDNPDALAQFSPGKSYYVDFVPVPE